MNSSRARSRALTPSRRAFGVRIREGPDVGVAVLHRQVDGLAHVFDDPFFVVFVLDPGRQLDGGHGAFHLPAGIGPQGLIVHHAQGVDLAQVQMPIDKGLGHQAARGIDGFWPLAQVLANFGDFLTGDANFHQAVLDGARACVLDQ